MDDAAVVAAFLSRYASDQERGVSSELADYQRRFPGFEGLIEREFAQLELATRGQVPRTSATALASALAGPVRVGHYELGEELAQGGQGRVFAAYDLRLHRRVALKLPKSAGLFSPERLRRFRREAAIASRLDHPGLCTVYDAGVERGGAWIAMRLVPGESLSQRIAARRAAANRRSLTRRELHADLALIERAARALHVAHEAGIVHRDVKPGNIMITPEGEPVLLDFGLAFDVHDEATSLTESGDLFGTPAYLAPERLSSSPARADRRADVFSLGVTLHELVTLRRPFDGGTRDALFQALQHEEPADPRRFAPALPKDFCVVLSTALEKEPDRRYQTALDLAEELRRVREGEPIAARPTPRLARAWRWARRRPAAAALIAALAIVLPAASALSGQLIANLPRIRAQHAREEADRIDRLLEKGYDVFAKRGDAGASAEPFAQVLAADEQNLAAIAGSALALIEEHRAEEALDFLDHHPTRDAGAAALDQLRFHAEQQLRGATDATLPAPEAPVPTTALGFFLAALRERDRGFEGDAAAWRRAGELLLRAVLTSPSPRATYFHQLAETIGSAAVSFRLVTPAYPDAEPIASAIAGALTELWPESPAAWISAASLLRKSAPAEAFAALSRALELDPNSASAQGELAYSLHYAGRIDEACEHYQRALDLDPNYATVCNNLGVIRFQQGKLEDALVLFKRCVELMTYDYGARVNVATTLTDLGRVDEAIPLLEELVAKHPLRLDARNQLGAALMKQERHAEAERVLDEAIALAPDSPEATSAYANLARVKIHEKQHADAVRLLQKAVLLEPRNAQYWFLLGAERFEVGQIDESIAASRTAIDCDPSAPDGYINLGVALGRKATLGGLKPQDDAVAALRKAVELAPKSVSACKNLGAVLITRGEIDLAVAEYERAVAAGIEDAEVHCNLAAQFANSRRYDDAIRAARATLELDPKNAKAHYILGNAFMGKVPLDLPGRADEELLDAACEEFRRTIELDENYAEAHCNLGSALQRRGKLREALEPMRRGHALGSARAGWAYPSADWVKSIELGVALEARLDEVLAGRAQPDRAAEAADLAHFCFFTRRYATAVRLWRDAFDAFPELLDDAEHGWTYNAARAAVMTLSDSGEDGIVSDEGERAKLRDEALGWLEDDLASIEDRLSSHPEQAAEASKNLKQVRSIEHLGPVRTAEALAAMPERDAKAWRDYWAAVDALLAKAEALHESGERAK